MGGEKTGLRTNGMTILQVNDSLKRLIQQKAEGFDEGVFKFGVWKKKKKTSDETRLEFGARFGFGSRFSRSVKIRSQVSARDPALVRAPSPRENRKPTLGWLALWRAGKASENFLRISQN
ncbi:hypothetical protein AVEN_114972-1 [Araneus ventricosus]|uniref:Uncharacterized protein n=1 Tax=Araneus ventricosus TaxID=182803 RepID=A0A4Y2DBG8_ARAVE|nr:hypothetical protein AVEN_114972-1 [Araneus ventricosus]